MSTGYYMRLEDKTLGKLYTGWLIISQAGFAAAWIYQIFRGPNIVCMSLLLAVILASRKPLVRWVDSLLILLLLLIFRLKPHATILSGSAPLLELGNKGDGRKNPGSGTIDEQAETINVSARGLEAEGGSRSSSNTSAGGNISGTTTTQGKNPNGVTVYQGTSSDIQAGDKGQTYVDGKGGVVVNVGDQVREAADSIAHRSLDAVLISATGTKDTSQSPASGEITTPAIASKITATTDNGDGARGDETEVFQADLDSEEFKLEAEEQARLGKEKQAKLEEDKRKAEEKERLEKEKQAKLEEDKRKAEEEERLEKDKEDKNRANEELARAIFERCRDGDSAILIYGCYSSENSSPLLQGGSLNVGGYNYIIDKAMLTELFKSFTDGYDFLFMISSSPADYVLCKFTSAGVYETHVYPIGNDIVLNLALVNQLADKTKGVFMPVDFVDGQPNFFLMFANP